MGRLNTWRCRHRSRVCQKCPQLGIYLRRLRSGQLVAIRPGKSLDGIMLLGCINESAVQWTSDGIPVINGVVHDQMGSAAGPWHQIDDSKLGRWLKNQSTDVPPFLKPGTTVILQADGGAVILEPGRSTPRDLQGKRFSVAGPHTTYKEALDRVDRITVPPTPIP